MFSKKIKKECEHIIAATVEMSQESQRGFKVFAIFAAVLVEYMVNHNNIFHHFRRNDSHDKKAKVYEDNINILRSKLQSGEIQPSKPEVLSVASYAKIIHKCPRSILETACYLAEDYNLQRNAYWGSGRTLPEPVRPGEEECRRFKVKNIKRVMKHKRMTFPFIEHNHLYARRINLSSVNSSDLTHFNVDETYVEQYNGTMRIVIYPVMFIDKRFFYCLHDIRVMGIDLGVNTDATCAIYDNSTGKCTLKQIRLPIKDKILQRQNKYKHTNNKETKESLRREIHALNEAYRKELAKAICQYAVENKVEFVFLEGLHKNSTKDETAIFWNPKSTLEVIYSELHGAGIAYRSVSAANTSQYYHKGGYVERDKENYSRATAPDGQIIDADANAAKNIVARGMIEIYFDSIPEEILAYMLKKQPVLLKSNKIIFRYFNEVRKYVDKKCNTNKITKQERDFSRSKKSLCKKYGIK